MKRELVQIIAEAFLGDYWKARLAENPEDIKPAFLDSFLHTSRVYPARRISKQALERALRPALLGRFSVRAPKGKGIAIVRIAPLINESIATDLARVKSALKQLETHCRIKSIDVCDPQQDASDSYRIAPDRALALKLTIEVPLENLLSSGPFPLAALARGTIPSSPSALRIESQACPHCNATHLIVYGRKSHAQDSDSIPFPCRQCGRVELCARAIPELVSYRIDLLSRMPWRLRRAYAASRIASDDTQGGRLVAWLRRGTLTQWILTATVVIPAIILTIAWFSDESFRFVPFRITRVLATLSCMVYGASLFALNQEQTTLRGYFVAYGFAATLALMIPVCVALHE